jgi:hypothetical protein
MLCADSIYDLRFVYLFIPDNVGICKPQKKKMVKGDNGPMGRGRRGSLAWRKPSATVAGRRHRSRRPERRGSRRENRQPHGI